MQVFYSINIVFFKQKRKYVKKTPENTFFPLDYSIVYIELSYYGVCLGTGRLGSVQICCGGSVVVSGGTG